MSNLLDKYSSIDVKKSKIFKCCQILKCYQDFHDTKKLYLILKILSQSGLDISLKSVRPEITEWLYQHNVFTIASDIICFIFSNNKDYINDGVHFLIFELCQDILINYLEDNDKICELVSKLPVIDNIYKLITNPEYHERLRVLFSNNFQKLYSLNLIDRKDPYFIANYRVYGMITSSWCIIHNLAAYHDFKQPFSNLTVYNSMINIMKLSRYHTLLIMTYSTLALIIDDENVNLLNIGEFSINYFIDVAYYELNKDPSIVTSFRLWEILNVLYNSIRNSDIANSFILKGGMQMIIEVLKYSSDPKEEKYAGLIIQKLVLNSETKHLIDSLHEYNFTASLKRILETKTTLIEQLVELGLKDILDIL